MLQWLLVLEIAKVRFNLQKTNILKTMLISLFLYEPSFIGNYLFCTFAAEIKNNIIMFSELLEVENTDKATQMSESTSAKAAELLKNGEFEELFNTLITWGIDFLGKLAIAILIFVVGRFIIKKMSSLTTKFFNKTNWEPSLEMFIEKIIKLLLYVALFVVIINIVGGQTVSLAALIGAAGLAIGMAVKDNLANFAGGVMLLANRPFKAGDFIKAQDVSGNVKKIGILYTEIVSFDGEQIFIPNGPLSTGNIVNYAGEKERRLEFIVGVDYGTNVEEVKNILYEIVKNHPKALNHPEPVVVLKNMNESSLDYAIRVFAKNADYWDLKFDLNELIYNKLNEKGINIPFPQMTVHMATNNKKDEATMAK